MSLKRFVCAGAAVTALVVGGLVAGCGSNPGSSNDKGDGGDGGGGGTTGSLVGEWKAVEESYSDSDGERGTHVYGNDEHMFYIFSSPNKLKATIFEKVDNFWIEYSSDFPGTWSTKGKNLYLNYEDGDVDSSQYSISGNTLTITFTYTDSNDYDNTIYTHTTTMKLTKTSLSSFKGTLAGTVRTQDSRLSGDTYWRLDDYGEELNLYSRFSYDGDRYFEEDYYTYGVWYTNGSNLFLISTEWECADPPYCEEGRRVVKETVQFTYTLGTSGGTRTLRLTNSSMGINDLWIETEYDYDDYDYSPPSLSKSKRNSKTDNGRFKPFWAR